MTVTTTEDTIHQTGNGVTNTVSYPYKFFAKTDLVVINTNLTTLDETTLVLGTDYTIPNTSDAQGYPSGAEITLSVAPDSNTRTTVYRNLPFTQGISYPEDDPFPAKTHEKGLDKLTLLCQQVLGYVNKALRFANTSTSTGVTVSQPIANRGLKYNADGTQIIPTDEDPDEILPLAQAAAELAQAAVGNVPTPVADNFLQRNSTNTAWLMRTATQVATALNIGDLSTLLTSAKTSIVAAINELVGIPTDWGNFSGAKTFTLDGIHKGNIVGGDATFTLPTNTGTVLRNVLFDFNKQPGRAITWPTNIDWVGGTPSLMSYPELSISTASSPPTISNMILTFLAASGQYVDLTNIPFNNIGSQVWKQIWKYTPSQVGVLQYLFAAQTPYKGPVLGFNSSNYAQLYLSSNGTSFDIANGTSSALATTNPLVNGTTYFFSTEFTGTHYLVKVSTDYNPATQTGTWTTIIDVTSSTAINSSSLVPRLGTTDGTAGLLKGAIDLSASSITINNGANLLSIPTDKYLNRVILDSNSNSSRYRGVYSQVSA